MGETFHFWLLGADHDSTNNNGGIQQGGVTAAVNAFHEGWSINSSYIIAMTGVDSIGNCNAQNCATSDQCIQAEYQAPLNLVRPDTRWSEGSCNSQEFAMLSTQRWKVTDLGVTKIGSMPSGQAICGRQIGSNHYTMGFDRLRVEDTCHVGVVFTVFLTHLSLVVSDRMDEMNLILDDIAASPIPAGEYAPLLAGDFNGVFGLSTNATCTGTCRDSATKLRARAAMSFDLDGTENVTCQDGLGARLSPYDATDFAMHVYPGTVASTSLFASARGTLIPLQKTLSPGGSDGYKVECDAPPIVHPLVGLTFGVSPNPNPPR